MSKRLKISLLAVSVVLVLGIFVGVNVAGVSAAGVSGLGDSGQQGAYRQINVYGEVLQHIQSDYVEVPNIPDVTNGALRGLLESLDADSSYLTPADYKAYKADKGGKAQVGIHASKRYGYATIVAVVPGSPADRANLTDGDIIEAIGAADGSGVAMKDTRDLSLAVINLMLQGAPGSELQLAVIRSHRADPEPKRMTLSRVVVSEPPVTETMYENASIVDVRPVVLDHEHVQQVEAQLKSMNKTGTKKVLLDLRDVAAGDMPEAVRLANFFIGNGTLATLSGQKFPRQTFAAEANRAIDPTGPVVVLVNRGTSGPGELVAAALADNKRAELVGEKTFGEGSLQKTFDLADGGAVILSVAKYASPAGKEFEDTAVTPGTLVASNLDDMVDDAPDAAAGDKAAAKATKKSMTVIPDDQLTKALEMLKAKTV